MAVSKRLRYEILRRDNHACRYCGASAPTARLTIDHVVPQTLGGSDDPTNLVTACIDCNAGKSSVQPGADLVHDVAADALRWANAMKRAAFIAAMDRDERDSMLADFDALWSKWTVTSTGSAIPRPSNWASSIEQFDASGLEYDDLADAVTITMNADVDLDQRWRYFCGVAWKKLRTQQETAQHLIERGLL